eukprot:CAMPEP_0113916454 /NCGR_PEP_ID=MMETSP0780_2-20120614/32087_1 /TAXON_ID=652834 /ORGANISM="Palpitomonas bilix" /LENGTH=170 /DNA_ID=CAMNT_0000915717 /DNA_START=59 /DNA_END=567 /DNA_ORIENTATION=- /assembly_acc=CAM_ASM_000599
MDKLKRSKKDESAIGENEVRITANGQLRSYVSYVVAQFDEKNGTEIVIKAMARAIGKAITVAETVKRRVANLHQLTTISSMAVEDAEDEKDEARKRPKRVSCIEILLSTAQLDQNAPGYQVPNDPSTVKTEAEEKAAAAAGEGEGEGADGEKRRKRRNRHGRRGRGRREG